MDEISQGPDGGLRLPKGPRRWLALAGIAGLVAAIGVYGVTRLGGPGAGARSAPPVTASLSPSIVVASAELVPQPAAPIFVVPAPRPPGSVPLQAVASDTALLTCDSVIWGRPPAWPAGSLRVGTLWIVDGRHLGFARLGRNLRAPAATAAHDTATHQVDMLVHVDPGSTVVMRAATGSWPSFEFLNSPASVGDFQGVEGSRGYTFVPCPGANPEYPGLTDFYQVGFSITPGHTASVEVLTPASARPLWVTLSAPR
jgi:hypothetical protein